jgi:arabinogalactan oligomer/maltooligosaccharide transport system substrate-binding protein
MRRTTQVGATVAGLALLLAACSSGSSSTSETTAAATGAASASESAANTGGGGAGGTLTIWADEVRAKPIQQLCTKFADANGVKCKVQQMDFGKIRESVVKQNQTGDVPDLFIGAHDWLGELVTNGVVAPIDITANEANFSEVARKAVTYDGTVYGVPYAVENLALFTNLDLVKDCPATLDDAAAEGLKLKDAGKVTLPIALQIGEQGDAYHWYPLYSASGGYIFGVDASGQYVPTDLGVGKEGGVQAGKALSNLAKAKVLKASVNGDIAAEAFNKGKSPYWITGPWNLTPAKKAVKNMKVCPVPTYAADSKYNEGGTPSTSTPMIGVQSFFQTTKAKEPAIASTFLSDYVETTEFMDAIYAADPRPPAWNESATEAAQDPDVAAFLDYGKQGIPQPAIPAMGAVWGDMGLAEFKIASGQEPVKTMQDAGASIEAQIAKAK